MRLTRTPNPRKSDCRLGDRGGGWKALDEEIENKTKKWKRLEVGRIRTHAGIGFRLFFCHVRINHWGFVSSHVSVRLIVRRMRLFVGIFDSFDSDVGDDFIVDQSCSYHFVMLHRLSHAVLSLVIVIGRLESSRSRSFSSPLATMARSSCPGCCAVINASVP